MARFRSAFLFVLASTGAVAFIPRGAKPPPPLRSRELARPAFFHARGPTAPRIAPSTSFSLNASKEGETDNDESDTGASSRTIDAAEIAKYGLATGAQLATLAGLFKIIDKAAAAWVPGGTLPTPVVALLFAFLSLRSRVASVLDNSRPNREAMDGKATPQDVKRPSWTPPGIAFPFIWLTITGLRAVSSAFVYRAGGALFAGPLLSLILHLCIGDTWNTITNIEKRLGVSFVGCLAVWASAWNAIVRYYRVSPTAGKILAPSGVWISVACLLTFSIWRINTPVQPLWPVKGDGKSAGFKWSNLGQVEATTISGGK